MDEPKPGLPPIIVPPPVLSVPDAPPVIEPADRGPWGFWATVGWAALIGAGYFSSQLVVGGVYAISLMTRGLKIPDPKTLQTDGLILCAATICSAPVVMAMTYYFAWLRQSIRPREYLGLYWPGWKTGLSWASAFAAFLITADTLTNLAQAPMPDFMVKLFRNAGSLPLLCFTVIIVAPLWEEFFFRGFLLTGLRQSRLGGFAALVLSSAPWALIHIQYNAAGMFYIFFVGLFLGAARLKTGSLLLCMVLHALMNLIATVQVALYVANGGT